MTKGGSKPSAGDGALPTAPWGMQAPALGRRLAGSGGAQAAAARKTAGLGTRPLTVAEGRRSLPDHRALSAHSPRRRGN